MQLFMSCLQPYVSLNPDSFLWLRDTVLQFDRSNLETAHTLSQSLIATHENTFIKIYNEPVDIMWHPQPTAFLISMNEQKLKHSVYVYPF